VIPTLSKFTAPSTGEVGAKLRVGESHPTGIVDNSADFRCAAACRNLPFIACAEFNPVAQFARVDKDGTAAMLCGP